MPLYHVHATQEPDEPFPPAEMMPTVEADTPKAAAEIASGWRIFAEPGTREIVVLVVIEWGADDKVQNAYFKRLPL